MEGKTMKIESLEVGDAYLPEKLGAGIWETLRPTPPATITVTGTRTAYGPNTSQKRRLRTIPDLEAQRNQMACTNGDENPTDKYRTNIVRKDRKKEAFAYKRKTWTISRCNGKDGVKDWTVIYGLTNALVFELLVLVLSIALIVARISRFWV